MTEKFFDKEVPATANELLNAVHKPDYPEYITKLMSQLRGWLPKKFKIDGREMTYAEAFREDPDMFLEQLSWVEDFVTLLPAEERPEIKEEVVALSLGEADLHEVFRFAIDSSLIFSRGKCRRTWIISDCWIPFDVFEHGDYIREMRENGISLRFLLVTPWGWMELPVATVSGNK